MYFERRFVRGALGALGALVAVFVANVMINWVQFSILTPPVQTKCAPFSEERTVFLQQSREITSLIKPINHSVTFHRRWIAPNDLL
jgi:hypothetical protein